MAHYISTLNRYVYLFLFLSLFIFGEPQLIYGQNNGGDESNHSATASISAAAQQSNPNESPDRETQDRLTQDDVFNAIVFPTEESTEQQDDTASTLLDESNDSVWRSIGNMLISLAFVIMVGLAIAWFMRRFVVRDTNLGGGKINMLASYTLSQKSKVYLLRVGTQTFLVGEGANELNMLSEVNLATPNITEEEILAATGTDAGEDVSAAGGFESKLNQWQSALKSKDMGSEVNTSLLLLGGLAQRLRNKREGQ